MTTIYLDTTLSIPLGRKACYGTLTVDTSAFNEAVQRHIYEYGLRQILNDAVAEKKDKDGNTYPTAEIVAKADMRLKNLYAGILRVRRSETEPADPIEAEAYKIARDNMLAVYKKMPVWHQVPKGTKNRFAAVIQLRLAANNMEHMDEDEAVEYAINLYLDKNPDIREKAARNVAEREEMVASLADGIV
jgi:hypothetical protein